MASIERRGKRWRAHVYRDGKRSTKTFDTKAQAQAWAAQRSLELAGAQLEPHTLGDALRRYAREVSPSKRGHRWETIRLAALGKAPIAAMRLEALRTPDLVAWRDARLAEVSPSTARRELNLLRSVFNQCVKEWHWLRTSPMVGLKIPTEPPSRRRRVTADEIERVTLALGYDGSPPENASQRVAVAFLFALETAMRAGEILGLTWADVHAKSVTLPRTKNGDRREVPLSTRARELLAELPADRPTVFDLNPGSRDALFRKAVKRAQIPDLHFHDSRGEAIFRLSKKLDVLELARMIGHRDITSLMFYYRTTAEELADKLG